MKNNDMWNFVCLSAYHTLNETVDRAVNWTVYDAVDRIVNRTVFLAVDKAVSRAVGWVVDRAVSGAVNMAVRNDPPHPSLNEFLTSNQEAT